MNAPFEFLRPTTASEAAEVMSRDPENVLLIAGGTIAVPSLRRTQRPPHTVIDLGGCGLDGVEVEEEHAHIGAMTTYRTLETNGTLGRSCPLWINMARGITGGRSIKNHGTVGGSASQANPSSDVPAVLVAVDAELWVRNVDRAWGVKALQFFADGPATVSDKGYVLERVDFEVPAARRYGYQKLKFAYGTWPIATAVTWADLEPDGRINALRLVLGAVSLAPVVVDVGECVGRFMTTQLMDVCAELARAAVTDPLDDEYAPGSYRRGVAGVVAKRALEKIF